MTPAVTPGHGGRGVVGVASRATGSRGLSKGIAVRLAEDGTTIDFPKALVPNEGHP
jgi:hypothetical protein